MEQSGRMLTTIIDQHKGVNFYKLLESCNEGMWHIPFVRMTDYI